MTAEQMTNRGQTWLNSGAIPERIVDLLSFDGGWLTTSGIAADLDVKHDSADRALWRLLQRGFVMRRPSIPGRHSESEWRAA